MATLKEIYRINELITSINAGQIAIEPTDDIDIGIKMGGYKDYGGTSYKWLVKDELAVVSGILSSGQIIGSNVSRGNFNATTDPTSTDDDSIGYDAGSVWINRTADRSWVCTDPTTNAALWTQTNGSGGYFVSSTGTASAKNPGSATSIAEGDFSFAQGENTLVKDDSSHSVAMGKDAIIARSQYGVVGGQGNSLGFYEKSINLNDWTFTDEGSDVMSLEGPNFTYPVYDPASPFQSQIEMRDATIVINGATSVGNDGVFKITGIAGPKVFYINAAGVTEGSAVDTEVEFLGAKGSASFGTGNFHTGSNYSICEGKDCYIVRAPFSKTTGVAAVNIWPGSHVHSNGSMNISSGSGSLFGFKGQTIKNIIYSGFTDNENSVDLKMFFGSGQTGETISNDEFEFRTGHRYNIKIQVNAIDGTGGTIGDNEYIQRELLFNVICKTQSLSECLIQGPIIENIVNEDANLYSSRWTIEPSIYLTGTAPLEYCALKLTANSANLLNGNFESATANVPDEWTVASGSFVQNLAVPPGATLPTTYSGDLSGVSGSAYQDVLVDGASYTLTGWVYLVTGASVSIECSGSVVFTTTTTGAWINFSQAFTATSNPRVELKVTTGQAYFDLLSFVEPAENVYWTANCEILEIGQ